MKKIIAFALVLTMMLSFAVFGVSAAAWDGTTASASLKGEGTASSPYLVESAEDLKYIQVQVAAGTTFEGKYFKQTADIDLNNKEWAPIGERTAKPFIGLYDGNGFKIVNFYQTFNYRFGGLFAYMTTAADFTPGLINVTLEGSISELTYTNAGADQNVGALVGKLAVAALYDTLGIPEGAEEAYEAVKDGISDVLALDTTNMSEAEAKASVTETLTETLDGIGISVSADGAEGTISSEAVEVMADYVLENQQAIKDKLEQENIDPENISDADILNVLLSYYTEFLGKQGE